MDIGHLALFILVAVFAIQLVRIITRPFRSTPSRLRALRQREIQLRKRELNLRTREIRQREKQLRRARQEQFAKAVSKLSPENVIPRLSRISPHTFAVYAAAVAGAFVGFFVL